MSSSTVQFGRWSLITLLCLLTVVRTYFKIRAGVFREPLGALAEGPFYVASRALFGLPLLAATLLTILRPGVPSALLLELPLAVRVAGTTLATASLALLAWVQLSLGPNFSTTVFLRPSHRLVTAGPYRLARHPMYSAYACFFASLFLVSGNWAIGACGLGMVLILMTVRRRREEALLTERFGEAYIRYRRETGAFVPRLRRHGSRVGIRRAGRRDP